MPESCSALQELLEIISSCVVLKLLLLLVLFLLYNQIDHYVHSLGLIFFQEEGVSECAWDGNVRVLYECHSTHCSE